MTSVLKRNIVFAYFVYFRNLFFAGLACKACSFEALSHNHPHQHHSEWRKRSSDALNNNLRPKSELQTEKYGENKHRRIPVTAICTVDDSRRSSEVQGRHKFSPRLFSRKFCREKNDFE